MIRRSFRFDVDGDGIPFLVEVGFRILDDVVPGVEGRPPHEEAGIAALNLQLLVDVGIHDLLDGIVLIHPGRIDAAGFQGLVQGAGLLDAGRLLRAERTPGEPGDAVSHRLGVG